jgi:hypothetical protein
MRLLIALWIILLSSPSWAGYGMQMVGGVGIAPVTGLKYESVSTGGYVAAVTDETITIAKPSGTVSGNILVAVISKAPNRTMSLSGWTVVDEGTTGTFAVLQKTAGSSEPSTYTFTSNLGYNYAHGVIVRLSGSASSFTKAEVLTSDWDTTLNYSAPNATTGTVAMWAGIVAQEGDAKTLSSITRGSIVYNSAGPNASAYPLYVAVEENVSSGSPITAAVGTLSSAINNKFGAAICVLP